MKAICRPTHWAPTESQFLRELRSTTLSRNQRRSKWNSVTSFLSFDISKNNNNILKFASVASSSVPQPDQIIRGATCTDLWCRFSFHPHHFHHCRNDDPWRCNNRRGRGGKSTTHLTTRSPTPLPTFSFDQVPAFLLSRSAGERLKVSISLRMIRWWQQLYGDNCHCKK